MTQQPVLSPAELDELYRVREQFRRAGHNLDSLLRQVYLYQNGVTVRGLEPDEFHMMLAGALPGRRALHREAAQVALIATREPR